jgi:hypothetical protein
MPRNVLFVARGFAHLWNGFTEIVTTRLHPGQDIRIDDGDQYPHLCAGGARRGPTLQYSTNGQLARDCDARLILDENEYDAIVLAGQEANARLEEST